MSNHVSKLAVFLSNPRHTRLVLLGLSLLGLLLSYASADPVAACIPLGTGGSCGGG